MNALPLIAVLLAPPASEVVLVQGSSLTLVATTCKAVGAERVRTLTVRGKSGSVEVPADWGTIPCRIEKSEEETWDFVAGEEELSMDIRARPVAITGAHASMLVSVQAGYEHTKRSHWLFVGEKDGRVKRAWDGGDGQGPSFSRVDIADGALFFTSTFDYGGEDLADMWSLKKAAWDPKKRAIVESDVPTWAAIAASRESLLEARAVEAALEKACDRRDLLVLETEGWPKLTKGLFFVTAPPVATKAEADAARGALAKCAPDAYVKAIR